MLTNGIVLAKKGGLHAGWTTEYSNVQQIVVATDPTNGPLIGILLNGTILVKEGNLTAGWVSESSGIQFAVAADRWGGPSIAIWGDDGERWLRWEQPTLLMDRGWLRELLLNSPWEIESPFRKPAHRGRARLGRCCRRQLR